MSAAKPMTADALARAFGAKRLGGVIGERIARGLFR
jgi:hypothetical protein